MMIRVLSLLLALLGAAPSFAEIPAAVDPADIPNFQLIRPGLAFGGQPSPDALGRLREMGFRTVINLRTEREGALDEEKVVRDQGLEYVWVPVTPGTFGMEDVEAVERILDDPAAGPVLLHCASGNRVAAVWAVIRARDGRTRQEAEEDGRAAGLHSPSMWEAVMRVLGWAPAPSPASATP